MFIQFQTYRNERREPEPCSLLLTIAGLLFITIQPIISQTSILNSKVRLTAQTTTVRELLTELSKTGGFTFSYGKDVPLDKQAGITKKSQSIRAHLDEIFEGDSLKYIEKGRKILIIPDQDTELSPESTGFNRFGLQQAETATMTGIVSDSKGNPLMYASVFISNTTLGTITNEKGEYRIINVPLGYHKIVASYLGYESKVIPLHVNKLSMTQNLGLKEQAVKIDEVMIQAQKSRNRWKRNLKSFEKNFIGQSDNAASCKIINPKALIFHYDRETRVLTATAREPLVIENNGLGYTIHFVLKEFEMQREGTSIYLGSAQFTPMKAENKAIADFWKNNRKLAYRGSLQHFLRVLSNNTLEKEGFVVQSCRSMVPVEIEKELDNLSKRQQNPLGREFNISPVRFYSETVDHRKFYYENRLRFINILHVSFSEEPESYTYGAIRNPRYRLKSFQQSWVVLLQEEAIFNTLGYLNDPKSVKLHGYWAFEKFAEALPIDYYPVD